MWTPPRPGRSCSAGQKKATTSESFPRIDRSFHARSPARSSSRRRATRSPFARVTAASTALGRSIVIRASTIRPRRSIGPGRWISPGISKTTARRTSQAPRQSRARRRLSRWGPLASEAGAGKGPRSIVPTQRVHSGRSTHCATAPASVRVRQTHLRGTRARRHRPGTSLPAPRR
jgi:hypothetical protein